jgi:hypothetical protein
MRPAGQCLIASMSRPFRRRRAGRGFPRNVAAIENFVSDLAGQHAVMAKPPTLAAIAGGLTVQERVLLFCLASNTDWVKAGITYTVAQHMLIRNLVERSGASDFVHTEQGRAVAALLAR